MAQNRGYDSLDSKSRLRLIEAASELLAEEGYLAISARRIADRARLKPQLVHYYFRSMEDLVVAVFHRSTANYFSHHDKALSSPHPLRELWRLNSNLPEAKRMTEFIALGKQYPKLRAEMRSAGENFRRLQTEAAAKLVAGRGIDNPSLPPEALVVLLSSIARNFVIEADSEISAGHAETLRFVGWLLDTYDPIEDFVSHSATQIGRR